MALHAKRDVVAAKCKSASRHAHAIFFFCSHALVTNANIIVSLQMIVVVVFQNCVFCALDEVSLTHSTYERSQFEESNMSFFLVVGKKRHYSEGNS